MNRLILFLQKMLVLLVAAIIEFTGCGENENTRESTADDLVNSSGYVIQFPFGRISYSTIFC